MPHDVRRRRVSDTPASGERATGGRPGQWGDESTWKSLTLSLGLHLVVLTAWTFSLRSCMVPLRTDAPGSPSDWIDAAIVIAEEVPPAQPPTIEQPPVLEQPIVEPDSSEPEPNETAETEPSEEATEPSFLRPLAMADAAKQPAGAGQPIAPPSRSGRVRPPAPPRPSAIPSAETGLFGIADRGNRLLYVIDRSASMGDDNAMRAAKDELWASIQRLEPSQQFQVLFYNTATTPLRPPAGAATREGLFFGKEDDRRLARRQWNAVSPAGGTRHLEPLVEALSYQPDVIFFLTDGEEPGLSPRERQQLKRRNGGRCRIHCIQFGRGQPLGTAYGFLAKLAADNGGRYAYRDTTQFR